MSENKFTRFFDHFASKATKSTGSSGAFLLASLSIVIWLVTGPVFDYSDTWQLIINTSTTIITFLMVFLIQKAQNKDSMAMQIKLNELIAVNRKASNRILTVEDLTEEELQKLHLFFCKLAEEAKHETTLSESHSIEEAEDIHEDKVAAMHERIASRKKPQQQLTNK